MSRMGGCSCSIGLLLIIPTRVRQGAPIPTLHLIPSRCTHGAHPRTRMYANSTCTYPCPLKSLCRAPYLRSRVAVLAVLYREKSSVGFRRPLKETTADGRGFGDSAAASGFSRAGVYLFVARGAVAMASSVVKRIPLLRFPARMKIPAPPAAADTAAAAASSTSGAESKTPSTTGGDAAASSRPLHSRVPSDARGGE